MLKFIAPVANLSRSRFFRGASLLVAAGALSTSLLAQPAAGDAGAADAAAGGRQRRGQNGDNAGGGRGGRNGGANFDPAAMQERLTTAMREQFGVADDAEWNLLSGHITKITELRRATTTGGGGGLAGFGGRGGGAPGGGGRGGRGGAANPEMDALRSAITDKLPDAEVKSRLDRLREVRKDNEAKLTKAQEDLRALLTVRQEAIAVMFGLLP